MSHDLLFNAIKAELARDHVGHKNELVHTLTVDRFIDRDGVIDRLAGSLLPFYSYYIKEKGLAQADVVDFLATKMAFAILPDLPIIQPTRIIDYGLAHPQEDRFAYFAVLQGGTSAFARVIAYDKQEQRLDTVGIALDDPVVEAAATFGDTDPAAKLLEETVNPMSFTYGEVTPEVNSYVQTFLENKVGEGSILSDTIVSGHHANTSFAKDLQYSWRQGAYDHIAGLVFTDDMLQGDDARFMIESDALIKIAQKDKAIINQGLRKQFAYGHKYLRTHFLDQAARHVIEVTNTGSEVEFYNYLTDLSVSEVVRENRQAFFRDYRIISREVFGLVKGNGPLNGIMDNPFSSDFHYGNEETEDKKSRVRDLVDRDGSSVDIKQLLPLVYPEKEAFQSDTPSGLSLKVLGKHLKGLTHQRTGGYINVGDYLLLGRSLSKEMLPTSRKAWRAFEFLSQLSSFLGSVETGQNAADKMVFLLIRDYKAQYATLHRRLKPFMKQLARQGGFDGMIEHFESLGLPPGLRPLEFDRYIRDSFTGAMSSFKKENGVDLSAFDKEREQLIDTKGVYGMVKHAVLVHRVDDIANDLGSVLGLAGSEQVTWHAAMEEPVTVGNYTFTPILNDKDLKEEGRAQHHCVGGYTASCLQGRSTIVQIKHASKKADSATLELGYDAVTDPQGKPVEVKVNNRQCRAAYNRSPSKSLQLATKQYVSKLNRHKKSLLNNYRLMKDAVENRAVTETNSQQVKEILSVVVLGSEKKLPVDVEVLERKLTALNIDLDAFYQAIDDNGLHLHRTEPVYSPLQLRA